MDSLADPASLLDREDVTVREETTAVDRDWFDYWADHQGMVLFGVTNDAGSVLLMDSPHGWRIPYVGVENGEDWVAVARDAAAALTGVTVDVVGTERVNRIEWTLAGEDRQRTSYDVLLRTTSVEGEPIAEDPSLPEWGDLAVGWFDHVPEDAYLDHEDTATDIRLFLD